MLKGGNLGNFAAASFVHLVMVVLHGPKKIQYRPGVIDLRLSNLFQPFLNRQGSRLTYALKITKM